MSPIRVWAPDARAVDIRANSRTLGMMKGDGGWWSSVDPIPTGTDYAFLIDGEGPFPDPRSPYQPQGVHGPSRHVDHAAFPWTDQHWQPAPLSSAVIYELHIGTFTPEGTFDSARTRLDHLASLGVTHVELMPVQEFSGDW